MSKNFWKGFLTGCLVSTISLLLLAFLTVKMMMGIFTFTPTEYTNPEDYQIIKEKMQEQNKIKHFPSEIPEKAIEIYMYGKTDMPHNGETFLLEFKIDRLYIEKELKKYDFWNKKDKLGTKRKIYYMPKLRKDFNSDDYTYYVLKEPENERGYREFFPYFNGIGVDGENNKILYYHIYPSD